MEAARKALEDGVPPETILKAAEQTNDGKVTTATIRDARALWEASKSPLSNVKTGKAAEVGKNVKHGEGFTMDEDVDTDGDTDVDIETVDESESAPVDLGEQLEEQENSTFEGRQEAGRVRKPAKPLSEKEVAEVESTARKGLQPSRAAEIAAKVAEKKRQRKEKYGRTNNHCISAL